MRTILATMTLLATLPAGGTAADPPPPLRLEELVSTRTNGHFTISRDGRLAALALGGFYFSFPVTPLFGEDNNLRVVDLRTGDTTQVTTGVVPKTSPRFSADGASLLYESEGDIFSVRVRDGASRRLTTNPSADEEGEWSPDGREIVFVSSRGGRTDLWVMSAEGERHGLRRLTDDPAVESDPQWSADGRSITYAAKRPDEHYFATGLYRRPAAGGDATRLTPADQADNGALRPSPDGKTIAYISDRSGYARVVLADPSGGEARTVKTPDGDCASPYWLVAPRFSPDGSRLLVSLGRDGRFDLVEIDVASATARVLREGDGHHHALGFSADGGAVYAHENAWSPPDLFVSTPQGPRQLTHSGHASFKREAFAESRRVALPSLDGFVVHATLMTRPGGGASRRPAIVNLHPNSYGQTQDHWDPLLHYLTQSGYIVLNVDQRGSAGYGRAYRDAAIGQWGTGTYDDVKAATLWLQQQPQVDPSRVGIMGLSFGGYLTLLGLVRDPDLFAAGIDLMGVVDRRGRFAGRNTVFHLGRAEAEDPDLYARVSPITQVGQLKAPLLILHADQDRNVSIEQTHLLVDELDRLAKPYEVHVYRGEAHGLADPRNQLDSYRRILSFFGRTLLGGPDPKENKQP